MDIPVKGLEIGLFLFGIGIGGLQAIGLYIVNDLSNRISRLEARAMGEASSWDGHERRGKR